MKTITKRVFAIASVLALGLSAAKAQTDSALLDALVKKGVLSNREAEDIRTTEEKDYNTTSTDKLSIGSYVSKLTLYGDLRFRYEYANEKAESSSTLPSGSGVNAAGNNGMGDNINERYRYRLRVGADYVYSENFKAGFELETNTSNDSANQNFGDEYNKTAINVGLVYMQWKPFDWLTLTGGKQHNPLYTTDLVWDPDINPEGGSEVASWTFPIGGGSGPVHNDPKDMKSMSAPAPSDESLTIGLTALQGIYADNQEFNPPGTNARDVWQFVEQVPVQFNFNKDMFVKVAPGFDTYMSGGNNGAAGSTGIEGGGGTENFVASNAADQLAIFTAPGEFDWKMWHQPFKAYWDFAYNLDGKNRIQDVYLGNGQTGVTPAGGILATQNQNRDLGDDVAWLVGLQVGQNKKKGDWSIRADYRQVGLGSVDPNLQDSDWGDSFLNQQGVKIQPTYNFTDFLTGSITFYDTWNYKNNLLNGSFGNSPAGLPITTGVSGTTASGITNLAGVSQTQRVDVDLQCKF
jgi:hypothetical protein